MATGGWTNKGEIMARLADHEIFKPILNHYDELKAVLDCYKEDEERLEVNLKIVLMKAFQDGQAEVLRGMKNANN